jgi:hypothetical protein
MTHTALVQARIFESWQYFQNAALHQEQAAQLQTVWGLYEHDLYHGGELAFVLGAADLSAPDM